MTDRPYPKNVLADRPWLVMILDDNGYESTSTERPPTHEEAARFPGISVVTEVVPTRALRPPNQAATELYWANCAPGTTHQVVGDVAIVADSDFA